MPEPKGSDDLKANCVCNFTARNSTITVGDFITFYLHFTSAKYLANITKTALFHKDQATT